MQRICWKNKVKMKSCLEDINDYLWGHSNTNPPSLFFTARSWLPCRSQAKQRGWDGIQCDHVPLSQHDPRGSKCDSKPESSLLTPGCRGSQLAPCLRMPPWFLSLCWVLCRSRTSWIHLSDSYPKHRPGIQKTPVTAQQKKTDLLPSWSMPH